MSLRDTLAGHFWTIVPALRHQAFPDRAESVPWSRTIPDATLGSVTLRGAFHDVPAATEAVVVVHGLGGTSEAHYCVATAHAARQLGMSCLRLALRGADQDGEDLYHAGIFADIDGAVASPELARFARIYVIGFSLGGHVTLRFALTRDGSAARDPRVRAVAAICAPLDLDRSARHMDAPAAWIYRRHVLIGLKAMYRAVAARRPLPTPLADVLAVRTIRDWDARAVVPRHGFGSVDNYYAEMSVGPVLGRLELPALLAQHAQDPMVPVSTYEDHLARPHPRLEVVWLPAGGHVGYPQGLSLGEAGPKGVEAQTLQWLRRQA